MSERSKRMELGRLRFQLRLAGVPINERADRDARLRDDKARLDLAGRTPKPGGSVTGPLFSPRQRELIDIAPNGLARLGRKET